MKKSTMFILFGLFGLFLHGAVNAQAQDTVWNWYQDDTVGDLHIYMSDDPTSETVFALSWVTIGTWQGWQWEVKYDNTGSEIVPHLLNILTNGGCDCNGTIPMEMIAFFADYHQFQQSPSYAVFLPMVVNN